MFPLRISGQSVLKASTRPILASPGFRGTRLATDTAATAADGASGKSTKEAEPKILNRSPPKEGNASNEVEGHNKEMDQRAEKPNEKTTQQDIEKDKVSKGFWSGQGQGN